MEGVQILNEFIYEGAIISPWMGIGLSCAIGGLVGLVVSAVFEKFLKKLAPPFMIICSLLFLFGASVAAFGPRENIPRYQVLIGDEVSFNEFIDHYKIVDQDGLIYTVEVKDESMADLNE